MGNKFGCINVKNSAVEVIPFTPDIIINEIIPGWITITHEGFGWGTTHKIAQKLSKSITETVLSVEYFDDDYVEFALYCDGKRVAIHIPAEYEDFPKKVGSSKNFVRYLSMLPSDEKLFRIIFAETDPATSVSLMESLLGCPIWVKTKHLDDTTPHNRFYLENYLKHKKDSKLKNQTRLVLCDEKDFVFGWHPTYPIVNRLCGNVCYPDKNPQEVWIVDSVGKLRRLFALDVCGRLDENFGFSHGHGVTTLQYSYDNAQRLYIFSNDGTLLDSIELKFSDGLTHTNPIIIDESRVILNRKCYNFREHRFEYEIEKPLPNEKRIPSALLLGVGPVFEVGDSIIEVADETLTIISRHKTKGCIRHFIPQNGKIFILTYRQEETDSRWENGEYISEVKKPSHIYIYELKK